MNCTKSLGKIFKRQVDAIQEPIEKPIDSMWDAVQKQKLLLLHQEHFTKLNKFYATLSAKEREGSIGKDTYASMKFTNEQILKLR